MRTSLFLALFLLASLLATPSGAQTLQEVFTEEDSLPYKGYEITKCCDPQGDVWFAVLKKEGKTLATFKKGFKKEWTSFGLFPFLGADTKQLIIEQFSGGAHCCWAYWIFDLDPHFNLIYASKEYPAVDYFLQLVDLDNDQVFELTQGIRTFDYFDRLCHALSPIPTVVLKYDWEKMKYIPANQLFPAYLLEGIEEDIKAVKTLNEKTDLTAWNDTGGEYLSAVLQIVLRYIYAGCESQGWSFYDEEYQLPDKEKMRSKIKERLKKCSIYRSVYGG